MNKSKMYWVESGGYVVGPRMFYVDKAEALKAMNGIGNAVLRERDLTEVEKGMADALEPRLADQGDTGGRAGA